MGMGRTFLGIETIKVLEYSFNTFSESEKYHLQSLVFGLQFF